jgi:hypothetical protein
MRVRKTSRLTIQQILAWADEHHRRTGRWPNRFSGHVTGSAGEKWSAIESALFHGSRGLAGGLTIPKLLQKHRGVRNVGDLPPLTVEQILKWADAHHRRTGEWPNQQSGDVVDAPGENWAAISHYFSKGHRGLPTNTTLALLLLEHRGVYSKGHAPPLTIKRILELADKHYERTGEWPGEKLGEIADASGETWSGVHFALYYGHRGLPGGSSLASVLEEHRGVRNRMNLPPFTYKKIVEWAQKHYDRTGKWPNRFSGEVTDSPGDTWTAVEIALYQGDRGLPGGVTLNKLLAKHCGKRDPFNPPSLSLKQILKWSDDHYERTGTWPSVLSGRILAAPEERWEGVNRAMRKGKRGLTAGPGITKLLQVERAESYRRSRTPLTRDMLLEWITFHHELTGSPPTVDSGEVIDEPGEHWRAIDAAMRSNSRGWRGPPSLESFIEAQYSEPYEGIGQRLTEEKTMRWAREYRERTGSWPTAESAYVFPAPTSAAELRKAGRSTAEDRPGERWATIDRALREGWRGLSGGSSLAKIIRTARGTADE